MCVDCLCVYKIYISISISIGEAWQSLPSSSSPPPPPRAVTVQLRRSNVRGIKELPRCAHKCIACYLFRRPTDTFPSQGGDRLNFKPIWSSCALALYIIDSHKKWRRYLFYFPFDEWPAVGLTRVAGLFGVGWKQTRERMAGDCLRLYCASPK